MTKLRLSSEGSDFYKVQKIKSGRTLILKCTMKYKNRGQLNELQVETVLEGIVLRALKRVLDTFFRKFKGMRRTPKSRCLGTLYH